MNTKPILFSESMVAALVRGKKTQTRRVLKPPFKGHDLVNLRHHENDARYSGRHNDPFSWGYPYADDGAPMVLGQWPELCPQGRIGDLLWVRETFAVERQVEGDQLPPFNDGRPVKRDEETGWRQPHYRATDPTPELEYEDSVHEGPTVLWKPSIHMPRWASRLTLRITDVRVQRLQDIDDRDAWAEGFHWDDVQGQRAGTCPRTLFQGLWNSLNGNEAWATNPWVWAITFEVIKTNVDAIITSAEKAQTK